MTMNVTMTMCFLSLKVIKKIGYVAFSVVDEGNGDLYELREVLLDENFED